MPLHPRTGVVLWANQDPFGSQVRQPCSIWRRFQCGKGMTQAHAHAMGCNAALPSASAYHLMPVLWCPKLRRVSYVTRMAVLSWSDLWLTMTPARFFHKIARWFISQGWPRFSRSLALSPNAPQHQFGPQREFHATQDWQAQLTACGIDPNNLASQVFRPVRDTFCTIVASRAQQRCGKGGKGGKREGQHPRPQGAGPGTGKGRHW